MNAMPKGQTIILNSAFARQKACELIRLAPDGLICSISKPTRSGEQNNKMWAMLGDVSRFKPDNRRHTPDDWKAICMNACGWETQFIEGLDGRPFPAGFRSSQMTVGQMADLITFIQAYGDERGVQWTDRQGVAA